MHRVFLVALAVLSCASPAYAAPFLYTWYGMTAADFTNPDFGPEVLPAGSPASLSFLYDPDTPNLCGPDPVPATYIFRGGGTLAIAGRNWRTFAALEMRSVAGACFDNGGGPGSVVWRLPSFFGAPLFGLNPILGYTLGSDEPFLRGLPPEIAPFLDDKAWSLTFAIGADTHNLFLRPIPEPSALWLVVAGLLVWAVQPFRLALAM